MKSRDSLPPEALLEGYPPPIRALAEELRRLVRLAAPDATERVRAGWRLIGYDVPLARRSAYFAFVAPEPEHVHIGFEQGVLMGDPDGVLRGRGITRQVRWLTFRPGDVVDPTVVLPLIREGARVATLSRAERLGIALERGD
jgi:hypothetical protein